MRRDGLDKVFGGQMQGVLHAPGDLHQIDICWMHDDLQHIMRSRCPTSLH
jgi:hypothetical protein